VVYIEPGLFNFLCGVDNFGKILFACGQHEIQYISWEMNKYMYNNIYNFTCIFLCIIYYKKKNAGNSRKIDQRNAIHILVWGVAIFFSHFYKIY